ncbi:MAG: SUMF1/EgtB/PvdO family nonheme iron enzyme [Spirochaeta sp.]|nr:SUMF1/EgtB/PvdO family nonheme iron enzyme [Spirochaeta sp.]
MLKKKNREPIPDFSEVRVKLKPFLGMPPGTYLTILYSVIVVLILFMVLFYPGIRRRGTYATIKSFPSKAEVTVDGSFLGITPCKVFIEAGNRNIEVKKPYYQSFRVEQKMKGRIFGTLFFPVKKRYDVQLKITDLDALLHNALADFAANNHIPEILSETVLATAALTPQNMDKMYSFIDNAKYFVNSPYQLAKMVQAVSFFESGTLALTTGSLLRIVTNIIQVKDKYDNFPYWLLLSLPTDLAETLTSSDWFNKYHLNTIDSIKAQQLLQENKSTAEYSASIADLNTAGLRFNKIPGGTLIQGRDDDLASLNSRIDLLLPHPVAVSPFYISETEITNSQFKSFISENPGWSKNNLKELLEKELVTEDYLSEWQADQIPEGRDDFPIVYVSFAAASAYCNWLSSKYSIAARLPYESEWEWAARGGLAGKPYPLGNTAAGENFFNNDAQNSRRVAQGPPNGYGLHDMSGNVWEWCLNWFSPVSYFFTSQYPQVNSVDGQHSPVIGAERVVRGGSWANDKDLVKIYTRGSQPPDWCIPYLGFRVVLDEK